MTDYYVDGSVGNDGNAGTSEGAGNAWATIQKALDTVSAGDHVYIKASATYSEALTISTQGSASAVIVLEGYTTTPGDGGIAVNDGGGSLGAGLTPASGFNFFQIRNLRFTDFTGTGAGDSGGDGMFYFNCRSDNNGTHGFQGDNRCLWLQCTSESNSNDGFAAGGESICYACVSRSNGGNGLEVEGGSISRCLSYSDGNVGISVVTDAALVADNVVDGNGKTTGTGINLSSLADTSIVVNNIVHDCDNGIVNASTLELDKLVAYNLVSNCTTNYSNVGELAGNVESAAAFVDEANSDYTPTGASPALDVGLDWRSAPNAPSQSGGAPNIGALEEASGGASGGLLMPNKRAGKQ